MNFELAVVIKTTILLVCAGMASISLKRAPSSIRHAIWTIALLCSLVFPLADALLPSVARMNLPVLSTNGNEVEAIQEFVPPLVAPAARTAAAPHLFLPATIPHPLSQWIAIAWALGIVFFLGRLIVASLHARQLVRRSIPMSDPVWHSRMAQLRSELSITQNVKLRSGGTTPPLTWGLFRHFILLPSDADSWTGEQQRAVLAHELAHAKRYDGLIQFLVQIVCILYWFNPIVWLAARRMRLERERACDDYVLNLGTEACAYADHLLDLANNQHWNSAMAVVSIARPSQLETRLRSILNPETRRDALSRWSAAILLSSLTTVMLFIAAIHLTGLLSLSLPTSFSALAAPLLTTPVLEPQQLPVTPSNNTGTVAGRVDWSDGAHSAGATVSAIATSTEGLPASWVMGTKVVGTAITDINGQYRIENLPAGLYHIVTGPVYLPRAFSDVTQTGSSQSGGPHLVTVTPGKTSADMNFTCVRNSEGVSNEPNRMLTITGKLVMSSFGGPPTPNVLVTNDDGSVSHWEFQGTYPTPGNYNARYWWPGFDAAPGGPIDKMAKAGETVTVTGTDTGYSGRWQGLHILSPWEVTRGGVPQSR